MSFGSQKIGSIHYTLGVETDKFESGLKKASRGAQVAGAAIVAGLGASVKVAADFEQRISDVSTLISGDATKSMNQLRDGILGISEVVPKSADELGASAYAIMSAGFTDAGDALKVLDESARLAVAGLGTTEEATTLTTVAMNAFGMTADQANDASDVLYKTVKNGITTVSKLSSNFGEVAGEAVSAGISFEDLQASTAALSAVTGDTAKNQTALRQVYVELTKAGGKLDKELEANGGSLERLNKLIAKKGTVKAFETMRDELGMTDTEFKNMFGSVEAGGAVFKLLTSANDNYTNTLKDMQDGANAVDEAFEKQTDTFNSNFQVLKNQLTKVMIEVGNELIPILIDGMEYLTEEVVPKIKDWIQWFKDLSPQMQKVIAGGIALTAMLWPMWRIISRVIGVAKSLATAFKKVKSAALIMKSGVLQGGRGLNALRTNHIPKLKGALGNLKNYMGNQGMWKMALKGGVVVAAIWAADRVYQAFQAMQGAAAQSAASMRSLSGAQDATTKAYTDILRSTHMSYGRKLIAINNIRRGRGLPALANLAGQYAKYGITPRAKGGPVSANKPYLVGENGPELFSPQRSGNITSNDKVGGTTNFNAPVNIAKTADAYEVMRILSRGSILADRGVITR